MKTIKIYISALLLMVCSAVNAQKAEPYLNVEVKSGVYKSYLVTDNLKVSWGDAKVTTGKAKALINNKTTDVKWVQLWAGGPKFAEYNVGVTDGKAESYGSYYTWGGFMPGVDTDYNTGTANLSGAFDTATKLWGANWRMPTNSEFKDLFQKCTLTWTDNYNGVKGMIVTGKGNYENNSIFLPAAGYYYNSSLNVQGTQGWFWTSSIYSKNTDKGLFFRIVSPSSVTDNVYTNYGWNVVKQTMQSVRAVLNE